MYRKCIKNCFQYNCFYKNATRECKLNVDNCWYAQIALFFN